MCIGHASASLMNAVVATVYQFSARNILIMKPKMEYRMESITTKVAHCDRLQAN